MRAHSSRNSCASQMPMTLGNLVIRLDYLPTTSSSSFIFGLIHSWYFLNNTSHFRGNLVSPLRNLPLNQLLKHSSYWCFNLVHSGAMLSIMTIIYLMYHKQRIFYSNNLLPSSKTVTMVSLIDKWDHYGDGWWRVVSETGSHFTTALVAPQLKRHKQDIHVVQYENLVHCATSARVRMERALLLRLFIATTRARAFDRRH